VLVKVADIVLVGELIDSADREGRRPDLSGVAPDLMGLFSELQQPVQDRAFPPAPPRAAKPSATTLTESLRRHRPRQQQLQVD
jgi:hypothetical protein